MTQRTMIQQQERHQNYNNRAGIYDGKIAGLYDLEETLGSGHFAVVKLARHVFTGEKVAVKVIDKTKLDEVSKAHLFQEVRCMKLVQHPHVVRLYEVIDTQTKLYLILELGDGGDLYDYIMRHETGLSETLARQYFRQIVRAISYCHQLHVVHRDLKPENVVFFQKLGVVKLTDFGFSNKFCPGQKLETSCGSLAYSAPEILLGDSYDAPAVDVWSLGVILYMLVCGQPPFQEANDSETLTMIMDCKYTMPDHVSAGCKKLISSMLVREPDKRSSLQQIAVDVWLVEDLNAQQPEYLPLVSREQVSEDDHSLIIQKMVNGNIALKDEILEALDKNEYNHITATYFLLAERRLKAQRQDQQQSKKKSDMLLPLSTPTTSSRTQSLMISKDQQDTNLLLVPGIMNAPRTPGAEKGQKGRNRKCSIVQEEDDDEDENEQSTALNRRGSRSEGRINLTVQDRLSIEMTERLKSDHQIIHSSEKEPETISRTRFGIIDGIAGIKIIADDNKEKFLGLAGTGCRNNIRLNSVEKLRPLSSRGQIDVRFLTESSTVSIPAMSILTSSVNQNLKPYQTMPFPPKPSTITEVNNYNSNCLKEIFEESDVCSSDNNSNTNTPRATIRSQQEAAHYRRTKFHKSRTTSGSSTGSDGSDEDNAEKKRATKIIDSVIVKQFTQRRDSHDDSSGDSQDPGTTCSSGNNDGSSLILRNVSSSKSNNKSSGDGKNNDNRGKTTTNSTEIGNRKHRTGRRRQTETRLRESQSLNRITEVQECEQNNSINNAEKDKFKNFKSDSDDIESKVATLNQLNSNSFDTNLNATNELKANKNQNNSKAKGFSARFLQNLNFKKNPDLGQAVSDIKSNQKSNKHSMEVLKLINAKAVQPPRSHVAQMPNDGSNRSKKIKILGRYFQVHKKICQPLSGLFRNSGSARLSSNLYKAQSCSSIIRDGLNLSNTINVNNLSTSSSSMTKNSIKFNEKVKNEHEFLMKNCFTSGFIGSDGDSINEADAEKVLDKQQQQLLDYIDDDILNGSKC